jgi:hypothetical protein
LLLLLLLLLLLSDDDGNEASDKVLSPLEEAFAAAFAVASLLAFLALVTLALKSFIEWQINRDLNATPKELSA